MLRLAFGMPSTLAVIPTDWPVLTSLTASSLNSRVYFRRTCLSLISQLLSLIPSSAKNCVFRGQGQARATLEALEAKAEQGREQVDLFAPAPAAPAAEPSAVEAGLARIDPDALTPREALEALYRLRGLLAR